MVTLIIGLILFIGAHSFRVLAPAARFALVQRLGKQAYKGVYSLVALAGLVLIAWGFSKTSSAPEFLYVPFFGLRHLNELLMLIALVLAVASGMPNSHIARGLRFPLALATILWAVGHLIVNGEVGTTVLFATFLVWAIADLISQSRRPRKLLRPPSWRFDAIAVVVGLALYAVLVLWAHVRLFGVSPIV